MNKLARRDGLSEAVDKARLAVIDELLGRMRDIRKGQRVFEMIADVGTSLLVVALVGGLWLSLAPSVPVPSSLLRSPFDTVLPAVPVAAAIWILWSSRRRHTDASRYDARAIADELDELKRIISDSR